LGVRVLALRLAAPSVHRHQRNPQTARDFESRLTAHGSSVCDLSEASSLIWRGGPQAPHEE
jgi:hypothetical protein